MKSIRKNLRIFITPKGYFTETLFSLGETGSLFCSDKLREMGLLLQIKNNTVILML